MRDVGVGGEAREERSSATDGARRCEVGRGYEADVDLGKYVVVIVGKIDTQLGLGLGKDAAKAEAAVVAQAADIEAGIARLHNADSRSKGGPVQRLVIGADAVILRVA